MYSYGILKGGECVRGGSKSLRFTLLWFKECFIYLFFEHVNFSSAIFSVAAVCFVCFPMLKSDGEFPKRSKYCWWKKSCTTWDVKNLVNNGINYLSICAGFLPSTVYHTWIGVMISAFPFENCCFSIEMPLQNFQISICLSKKQLNFVSSLPLFMTKKKVMKNLTFLHWPTQVAACVAFLCCYVCSEAWHSWRNLPSLKPTASSPLKNRAETQKGNDHLPTIICSGANLLLVSGRVFFLLNALGMIIICELILQTQTHHSIWYFCFPSSPQQLG